MVLKHVDGKTYKSLGWSQVETSFGGLDLSSPTAAVDWRSGPMPPTPPRNPGRREVVEAGSVVKDTPSEKTWWRNSVFVDSGFCVKSSSTAASSSTASAGAPPWRKVEVKVEVEDEEESLAQGCLRSVTKVEVREKERVAKKFVGTKVEAQGEAAIVRPEPGLPAQVAGKPIGAKGVLLRGSVATVLPKAELLAQVAKKRRIEEVVPKKEEDEDEWGREWCDDDFSVEEDGEEEGGFDDDDDDDEWLGGDSPFVPHPTTGRPCKPDPSFVPGRKYEPWQLHNGEFRLCRVRRGGCGVRPAPTPVCLRSRCVAAVCLWLRLTFRSTSPIRSCQLLSTAAV